jgi:hypothetical protein
MTPLQLAVWSPDPVATHAHPSGSLLLSLPHACIGGGHGGPRKSTPAWRGHPRSVSPAALAGVRGRHGLAEPVPVVGRGCGNATRRLAWGKQKVS